MNDRPISLAKYNAIPWLVALAVLAVAVTYLPVRHAGFVWDDLLDFHDMGWLREGDAWRHYVLKDFNGWVNYFRPLGVLLFTAEVRLFQSRPGPMHVVSLCMHLLNMWLVFVVARRFARRFGPNAPAGFAPLIGMTIYGLHPLLIEPVAWIGCQFELLLIMFMSLGLLASMTVTGKAPRALAVAMCFFLAACSKESAVAFPLLLVLFDWLLVTGGQSTGFARRLKHVISANWMTYGALTVSGLGYLAFREWALGDIFHASAVTRLSAIGRIQEVCFLYLKNLEMLVWPVSGMSPIHPMQISDFNTITIASLLRDVGAALLVGYGTWSIIRLRAGLGALLVAATISLLPVLHIIPSDFDSSLYHERYVMTALAMVCMLLPIMSPGMARVAGRSRLAKPMLMIGFAVWLLFSVANIRVTLPLWSTNVKLWQWALAKYPGSTDAKDNLLSAYIRAGEDKRAHLLIDQLLLDPDVCANCMVNAAVLAIHENAPAQAQKALNRARDSRELAVDRQLFGKYLLTTGQMLFLQGKPEESAEVLRGAMENEPLDPEPILSLALVTARNGDVKEARSLASKGLSLLPPDTRAVRGKLLEAAIASDDKRGSSAN